MVRPKPSNPPAASRQHAIAGPSVLAYASLPSRRPLRPWVLIVFLSIVAVGELFGVARLYRRPWPLPGDYALAGVLLAGAVVMAITTRLPGWLVGLYGLIGACFFYPGQIVTRDFYYGLAEPGAVRSHFILWSFLIGGAWLSCRSAVLLRYFQGRRISHALLYESHRGMS